MKRLSNTIIFTILLTLSACKSHYATGWYQIADEPDNQVIGNVLFRPSDFTDIILDTIPEYGMSYIQGRIISERRDDWANTTERLIGKRIGFVYNDSIITAPQINTRIESGNFQINSNDNRLLKSIYNELISNSK